MTNNITGRSRPSSTCLNFRLMKTRCALHCHNEIFTKRYAHIYTYTYIYIYIVKKKIITSYIKDTTVSVNSYIFGQSTKAITRGENGSLNAETQ